MIRDWLVRVAGARALGSGPQVLNRPGHGLLEFAGRAEWPVGVAQEFPGNDDRVGFATVTICSACAGVVIMPTVPVRMSASRRI